MMAAVLKFAESVRQYVPVAEVAREIGVDPSTLRRLVHAGQVVARERDRGKGSEIDVLTLPPEYKAAYLALHPNLTERKSSNEEGQSQITKYTAAGDAAVRHRADDRLEAVLSFEKARATRQPHETLAEVEARWLRNFSRSHSVLRISLSSVKRWSALFAEKGLDGLMDGNDGTKQRGVRIPAKAKQLFRDLYLRPHRPNLRVCYDQVVEAASLYGWGEVPTYETFRRYVRDEIPVIVRRLHRENADKVREIMPHVRRDPSTIPAMHTIQSDTRELDIPVRCDQGCAICTGKKARGHFPYWTIWMDVRSRRILTTDLSNGRANSERVLSGVRRLIDENGLPTQINIDNGTENVGVFGKRARKVKTEAVAFPTEERLQARFAALGVTIVYSLPGNPQGKATIERVFRTFRHRFDERFESFRGALGERSARAHELYSNPDQLPTLSELAFFLQNAIEEYNDRPHSGRGMDGKTPNEVFAATRLERVQPDPKAWALLFFEPVPGGRLVGPNGIQFQRRIYRLANLEKHIEYYGRKVDVRISPDDPRNAIVLDDRTGAYICEAQLDEDLATYTTADMRTRSLIGRFFRDARLILQAAGQYVDGRKERIAALQEAFAAHLKNRRATLDQVAATAAGDAVSAPLVIVPQYSALARERERALASASDLTADSVRDLLEGAGIPDEEPRADLSLVPALPEINDDDRAVLEQIRRRELNYCAIDFCDSRVGASGIYCTSCERVVEWSEADQATDE